jgi:hypothetical protein
MTFTLTYRCHCKNGTSIDGRLTSHPPIKTQQDRDIVTSMVLRRLADSAIDGDFPWDPFNLILEVRAQAEPKPITTIKFENKSSIACLSTEDFMELLGKEFTDEEDEDDESNT